MRISPMMATVARAAPVALCILLCACSLSGRTATPQVTEDYSGSTPTPTLTRYSSPGPRAGEHHPELTPAPTLTQGPSLESGPTWTSAPSPDIPNWGRFPVDGRGAMPISLDCSRFGTPIRHGPTWHDLTVGVSMFEDVLAAFAPVEPFWSYGGNLTFDFPPSDAPPYYLWLRVETCFTGNILSAMNIGGDADFNLTHSEWVAIYGRPDRVTWSAIDCDLRTLIWAEEGFLVVVGVESRETFRVTLFSPMTLSELENSPLLASFPTTTPAYESSGDPIPLGCGSPEDPWGITSED